MILGKFILKPFFKFNSLEYILNPFKTYFGCFEHELVFVFPIFNKKINSDKFSLLIKNKDKKNLDF